MGARRQADEAVAPEALTAYNGLQQKAVLAFLLAVCELEVEGKWCFEISECLGDQGDSVEARVAQ